MKRTFAAALVAAAVAAALHGAPAHADVPSPCDSACLNKLVDDYFAALVAHDPGKLPLAADVKFVENVKPTPVGSGLWKTASEAPSTFKIYVPDPVAQQVGFIGTLKEEGRQIEIGLRLKVVSGKISEIEHVIVHKIRDDIPPAHLERPRPALLAPVPANERMPREEMLRIGATYYDAIVTSNGRAAPFASDCVRRENGMQTTGNPPPKNPGQRGMLGTLGCEAQLDSRVMSYIKRIEPRRVWIADVPNGLVFGLSQFRHPQTEKTLKIVGVPGVTEVTNDFAAFDMPSAHIFKVRGGKIHEIEALGFQAPYNSPTGWE